MTSLAALPQGDELTAHKRRPNPEHRASDTQRQEVAKGLHDDIDNIVRAWPQIQHMAYTMGRGFPTQPPDSTPPRQIDDDELEHGHITLTLVERLAHDDRPDIAAKAVEWFAHLTETLGHIRWLASEAAALTWTPKPDAEGEPACRNHHTGHEPVHKNLRCRWCYDFWLAESADPPPTLIAARDRGDRITQRMVREALQPPQRRR